MKFIEKKGQEEAPKTQIPERPSSPPKAPPPPSGGSCK